ncbi:NUC130/3NT domain protein [Ancylostoma duodenale]|uniref:Protein SDA1 n=1 Tax=Ancylostoma duodenale TaxID=51022 RepID=A0A0C2FDD7_9BILA|nr:NUC130/3NT domain protein [Ancylostoma duodenale]
MEQFDHYLHTMKLLHLQPQQHRMELQPLLESITFLSGLAKHYPEQAKEFSSHMLTVLREQASGLDPHVRMSFCKALVLLRNQDLLDPMEFIDIFFELVKVEDKQLRKFILGSISSLLKRLYTQKKNMKLLGKIQNFCFAKMKDSRAIVARAAQLICIDAFRKKYWRDAKCANVIAEACFHKVPKIQAFRSPLEVCACKWVTRRVRGDFEHLMLLWLVTAMKFFLGSKKDEDGESDASDDESESEEERKTIKEVMTAFRHAKKTRKRAKDLERSKKAINKKKKAKKEGRSKECNLLAIQLLYDPQEFADKLFRMLESKKIDKYEVRLFRIALCARVIGVHRLHTLSFYSYLHRYLQPKQRDVTRILLYAAQACHEMVPPDTVEQLVRTIANNFVTDRNSPEAITVGINAIREILANCPFAATEELLRDLAEYKTYKNKNVSMAARALITLFRAVNPRLLARKDRGRPTDGEEEKEFVAFAKPAVAEFVPGAEILEEHREETGGMEVDDVEDSDESIDISDVDTDEVDSDDEGPPAKKRADESGEWEEEVEDEDAGSDNDANMTHEESGPSKEPSGEAKQDPKKKAELISTDRILTQEEFKQIRIYQLKKKLIGEKRLKKQLGNNRKNDDVRLIEELGERMERRGDGDGLPRLKDIEQFHKKRKQTKEERMADIKEGRDEDQKFGRPKKNGPHVGRTNRELAKKKVFSMVKAKVRGKNRQRSFRDQQKSLRNYLLRQSGRKPQ